MDVYYSLSLAPTDMPNMNPRHSALRLSSITFSAWLLASCSGNPEAPQVSFCKTLSSQMTGVPDSVVVTDIKKSMARFEDMKVDLSFNVNLTPETSRPMSATCFYSYDSNKEEGMIGPDLVQNYETSPHRMIFNGIEVPKDVLLTAVNKGVFVQAEANLKAIRQSVEQAAKKVREAAESYQ